MPTYTFVNNDTGEYFEEFMNMSDLDEYVKNNPNVTQTIGAVNLIAGVPKKPDDGFRDILRRIKKGNSKGLTRSTINTY
jgi:hypothetical protein